MVDFALANQPNEWLTHPMTSSLTSRVAVVGSAQTDLRAAYDDRQHVDLITEAVTQALLGTGLTMADVDFVIDSGSDFLDGRSISNCGFLGAMGAHQKEESRVEEDGLWSVAYATAKLLGGTGSVALVVAYSKSSESDPRDYWSTLAEPFTQRPVGLDHRSAAGLYAQRYLRTFDRSADELKRVSDHAWSRAVERGGSDAATYDAGSGWDDVVAAPLTRRDLSRPVDGAVAVVLATEHVARQIGRESVWVTGMGSAIEQHFLAAREPATLPAAEIAAGRALQMAGLDSVDDLDVIEVSAGSTVGELMVVEALGLAEPGQGLDLYAGDRAGVLNPSGGALPADPVMATGLVRFHEVVCELAGRTPSAGGDARRGLAHGTGGLGMQNHCVVTVERA
jgi:acetyl-CoA C-acetyltransferase